jgi:nonsense-mediated mRNA decay protein 3
LKGVVPVNVKTAPELISEDIHSGSKSMKFAFSVEILPICKDDLVALPIPLARKIGNISPIALCWRIGTAVNLMDPATLQTAEIPSAVYWREKIPFTALADSKDLVEFVVLDIEPVGPTKGRWTGAEATVARAVDLGSNDTTYFTRTHLGSLLQPGDSAMGYMLTGSNFNNYQLDEIENSHAYGSTVPDVVLVKKHWPRRRKNRKRKWQLKRMAKEESEMLPKKTDQARMDAEYEAFLRDVEEDDDLQGVLNLYKAQKAAKRKEALEADQMSIAETEGEEDDEGDAPQISMDDLLDDMEELNIVEEKGEEVDEEVVG